MPTRVFQLKYFMDESPLKFSQPQHVAEHSHHMSNFAYLHNFLLFGPPWLLLKTLFLLHFVLIHNPQQSLSKTMASEQERRDSTTKERETLLEAKRVPKMTSHFESLSEKVKGGDMARSESTVPPSEEGAGQGREAQGRELTGPRTIGKFEMNVGEEKGSSRGASEVREGDTEKSSKEEVHDEEKKTTPSLEEISKFREKAQQNSIEAIRAAEERYQKAKEGGESKLQVVKESVVPRVESATTYATEKGAQAKDTALEKSQQGYTTAKDTLVTAGKTAADYTKQTAEQAKDYTLQKATQAKDVVVSSGETAVQYVGEKAVAAKDVSLETGKGAAEYAGKKAAELKDKALATGWGAAHYTTEKAVEATKAAAGAIQSTAEYTDEKVVDYTGRKKEEALQELAAKQSPETQGESGGEENRSAMPAQGKQEMSPRGTEHKISEGVGGVLEAVGETVLEIAQATKELVIGKDQTGAGEKGGHGGSPMESTKAEQRCEKGKKDVSQMHGE